MKKLLDARYVGWAAILSGLVDLIGLVFLVLFYILEAPRILQSGEPSTPPLFGTLNDASFIFVALFMIPVAVALHQRQQNQSPALSWIALATGLIGVLVAATTQALYVPRVISTAQQSPLLTISIGTIGVWLFLVNLLARRGKTLPNGLGWLGMAVGASLIFLPVTYFAGGGSEMVNEPGASLSNPLVIAGFVVATLGLAVVYPVWAILLGRVFLHRQVGNPKFES
jgi:hypothetical protein